MKNIIVVFGLLLALIAGYNWIAGPRDPVWRVKLSNGSAFTLASTILARGDIRGCGDLRVTSQYPGLFQIEVLCNGQRSHTITYKPSFEVDGNHVEFTWLERAYCIKLPDGKWEQSYLHFREAANSAEALSNKFQTPILIYSAASILSYLQQLF